MSSSPDGPPLSSKPLPFRQIGDKRSSAGILRTAREVEPISAWASPALGRAYDLVEKLRRDLAQPTESGIDESLRRAMEVIEAADCELAGLSS